MLPRIKAASSSGRCVMASRIVVHDRLHNAPALLIIGRVGNHVQINEFDLTIDQALMSIGDLLDTIKAAALAEAESAVYHHQAIDSGAVRLAATKSVNTSHFV